MNLIIINVIKQCGTTTWFGHFKNISGLDEECITYQKNRNRNIWTSVLGQYDKDTNINELADRKDLLAFTFVRHPFDR